MSAGIYMQHHLVGDISLFLCSTSSPLSAVNRKTVQYAPKFDRFVLSTKDYSQQYNGVYLARLAQMRASLR
jgi:hypothetical protein